MAPETQPTPSEATVPNDTPINPVEAVTPSMVTTVPVEPAPVPQPVQTAPADAPSTDSYDAAGLTLYIVTMFSGASVLASVSYLVWNVIDYFTKTPEYSLFDFSDYLSLFTIYVIIYATLFTTVYALASMRLDARIKKAGRVERPLNTASAVWRATLVVWGVGTLVGLLYSPLSAARANDFSSVASEVASALSSFVFVGLVFWRDLTVTKMRSGMIAIAVISALVLLIGGTAAYANFHPKQAKSSSDYSSSYDF